MDRSYAISQEVMRKDSPDVAFLGCGLIVGGLLARLGVNNNKTIYGIPNCIPSPSNLFHAVNKSHEATFMRIAGFFCNCPCSMSCDKG